MKTAEENYKLREVEFDTNKDDLSKLRLNEARVVFSRELVVECSYWCQTSNIRRLKEGDANIAFFHGVVRQRRNMNFISRVKEKDGSWVDSVGLIQVSAIAFNSQLFESEGRPRAPQFNFEVPKVTDVDNAMLLALPSLTELKEVVFSMDINSTPGLDRFGAGFYQLCWDIIKVDLLQVIHDFFFSWE